MDRKIESRVRLNLHRITITKLKASDGTTFALTPLSGGKKC